MTWRDKGSDLGGFGMQIRVLGKQIEYLRSQYGSETLKLSQLSNHEKVVKFPSHEVG